MIHRVEGTLLEKEPGRVVVDVGGVGLEVLVADGTWRALPGPGAEARLRTHLVVREDAWLLFGFGSEDERAAFRVLLGVQGVGPRLALAVLSVVPLAELGRAVAEGDVDALVRVPGVGKKTAQRMLVDLRDRLDFLPGDAAGGRPGADDPGAPDERDDAVDALVALGYPRPAAREAVRRTREAAETAGLPVETVVKEALRRM